MKTRNWTNLSGAGLVLVVALLVLPGQAAAQTCATVDRDGDGDVDLSDLSIVTTDFGCVGVCAGDVNGDGMTDFNDLNLVIGFLGCPAGRICCNTPAAGTIFAQVVPVANVIPPNSDPLSLGFYGGQSHYTFDLQAVGVDWFGANVNASLTTPGPFFFAHPLEAPGGDPPNPALFGTNPALEFDGYFTQATIIPPGASGIPAGPAINALTPFTMDALWTDTVILPAGVYTIARYTIVCPPNIVPKIVPSGTSTAPVIGGIRGCIVSSSTTAPDCFQVAFDIVNCSIPGDVNGDCQVNITDLAILLGNFGIMCP